MPPRIDATERYLLRVFRRRYITCALGVTGLRRHRVQRASTVKLAANLRTHIPKAGTIIYRASQSDCASRPLKAHCCPNTPMRKIVGSIHESAREVAREIA